MSALRDDLAMSVEEFVAFIAARPDDERWELFDGELILNPSPSYGHQKVVGNLLFALKRAESDSGSWETLPGLGVLLSDRSLPVPDIVVRPTTPIRGHFCDDMIVAFEVISPSSGNRDLRWKRQAYTALPSLAHYVVLQQDRAEAFVFDRSTGFQERVVSGAASQVRLDALGISLDLTALYWGTGLL